MTPQLWITLATLLGFGLTAGNLVSAYLSAKQQPQIEQERIETAQRLSDAFTAERAHLTYDQRSGDQGASMNRKYQALYADHGLIFPSIENVDLMGAHDAKRLIELILDSTRGNLIWAGVGLLISTGASVWSVFI